MTSAIDVTCGGCGKTMRAPADAAGRKARCRSCGAAVQVPTPQPEPNPAPVVAPPTMPPSAPEEFAVAAQSPIPQPAAEPAPWFYKVAEVSGSSIAVFSGLVMLFSAMLGIAGQADPTPKPLPVNPWWVFTAGVGTFVGSALMLVIVDIGQSLRLGRRR